MYDKERRLPALANLSSVALNFTQYYTRKVHRNFYSDFRLSMWEFDYRIYMRLHRHEITPDIFWSYSTSHK